MQWHELFRFGTGTKQDWNKLLKIDEDGSGVKITWDSAPDQNHFFGFVNVFYIQSLAHCNTGYYLFN